MKAKLPTKYKFCLYVAGDTQNSIQAIGNLGLLCRVYLPDGHDLEIVDVLREPKRALADGVFMTPALVKLAPWPIQKIVGTLANTETVLQSLGIDPTLP